MDNSFEFDYFIKFSQNLLNNKDLISNNKFQCVYRTIIGKVYYAAFHHAKSWLELDHGFKTREFNYELGKLQNKDGLSEHVLVFKELRRTAKSQKGLKTEFRLAASKLESLFDKRLDADYDENVIFQEKEVTDAIHEASYIIDLLPFSQS